jgi:hypothetical protein
MVQLIDIQSLSDFGFIHTNINAQVLRAIITRVQDLNVEPVLGTPLFARLKQGIEDDDLTNLEEILLQEYIRPFIVACAERRAVPHASLQIREKGVGQASDPNFSRSEAAQRNELSDQITKDIAFYENKLIGYLKDNTELYPLYSEYDCDSEEQIKPSGKTNSYKRKFGIL